MIALFFLFCLVFTIWCFWYFGSPSKPSSISPIVPLGSPDGENAPTQELQYFCIKDKGYYVSVWPKNQPTGGYIEFSIAGISYCGDLTDYLGEFIAILEPEPSNPYDANAIKIMTDNGHRVGYVPCETTATIRDFTTLPCQCYCFIGNNDGIYFSDCYITKN